MKTIQFVCIITFFSLITTPLFAVDVNEPVQIDARNDVKTIVAEPLTLDIHFHYHHRKGYTYSNDWPVEKHASSLTGIALNNVTPDTIDAGHKSFSLLMANGDLPDIVGGTDLREKFNHYGPKGLFEPLNDLIDQHAPHIKQYFSENPDILKAITAGDGKLYHIPYIPDGKFARAYFIRTDWLNKLGLAVPETVDELYQVLTAFKKNDPNGNGFADEIPYFSRTIPEMIRLVTLWDARTTGTDRAHDFYLDNGEIRHGYVENGYKNGMVNLAKWYSEGLIDNDIYSRSGDTRKDLLGSDVGGMTHDWFASTASFNDQIKEEVDGFEFKVIAPPQSISGKRFEENRRIAVKPDGWAITSNNESIVETIKYFDFWFSPYGRRLANFGLEGSEYTLINDKPIFNDDVLQGDMPVNKRLWSIGAQVPRGFVQDYEYEKQWTNTVALEGIALYEKGDYLEEPFHGVTLNVAEKEVFDYYWTEILSFMLERQEEWILGLRDVNEDWDAYLVRIDKLGIDKVIDVMQTAYDRQYRYEKTAELD